MKKTLAIIVLILAFCSYALAASYVVKPGDSLWKIATSHSTTVNALIEANSLTTTELYPGQVLTIGENNNTYRIQSGDTMYKIAVRLGVSLKSLIEANPQVNPNLIYVGQLIKIPTVQQTIPISNFSVKVVELVNLERAKRGLAPLRLDGRLTEVAQEKAQEMVRNKYFSHTSPSYGSPFEMMQKFGIRYSAAGENIARGQTSPGEVMADWMQSSGHRSNILYPNFDTIGVGHSEDVWVQMFIKAR
jgi:uncharacterized YkwD family protein